MARRRKRRRQAKAEPARRAASGERDHMARVHASDEVWAEFRTACYPRTINVVLGELVAREVERQRSRRLRQGQLDDVELVEALGRARELERDLSAIVARLESRLDRARSGRAGPGQSLRLWSEET